MVMAGNESTPGTLTEDSLATRLQWLRQRREKLQEKLTQKNNELKNLCVEEAELTGVLPPEIPLEPGESPPAFRRRVGTAFTYPQNLINRLKTNEAEESALELERQVQIGIVEAALGIVNDPTESKAVRRKHRLVYQQSQQRLQELDARLHFLRQSRGKSHRPIQFQHVMNYNAQSHLHTNVKHRTKKPRPPLDNGGIDRKSPKSLIQESGINLSPLGPEHKCNAYSGHGYDEQPICNHGNIYSTVNNAEHRPNVKIIEHDHNDNHNVYILPDQYRSRTYSHGSGGSRGQNHYPDDRIYRPLPNTYNDEEHSVRHRQYQDQLHRQKQLQEHNHQYIDYKHLDNDIQQQTSGCFEREYRTSHCMHSPDYHGYKNPPQSQLLQRRDRSASGGGRSLRYDSHLPPGYWVRHDDEVVWCADDQHPPPPPPPPVADRFGSLDRRKRNALQYTSSINTDAQTRYRTVAVGGSTKNAACGIATHQHPSSVQLLPLIEQQPTSNKLLLRTQSLGSVETWHSGHSHDSQSSRDTTDNVSRKSREKEWYETSLDSGTSPGLDLAVINAQQRNIYCQPSPPPLRSVKPNEILKVAGAPLIRKKEIHPVIEDQYQSQCLPLHQPPYEQHRPKVLEIPAESKPSCLDTTEEAIRLGSPQNCTIVQAGKYQPYREVTKPFEMSDFYKYSTKFRKKGEAVGHTTSNEPQQEAKSVDFAGSSESYKETQSSNYSINSSVPSPVQKRIYQPVQRMTCQPYIANLR